MDGFPALDLWDKEIEVLRSSNHTVQPNHNGIRARPNPKTKTQNVRRKQKVDQLSNVDYVPTDTFFSR